MKRGVLGGTFDPPHLAHLILAQEARIALGLDRVTFVPAGEPWRKANRGVSPAADRLEMVRLAIVDEPAFDVSTAEIEREGPSSTAETLATLAAEGDDLFLLVGADAAIDLQHWIRPEEIVRRACIAVALRPGWDEAAVHEAATAVPGMTERLAFFPMPLIEISSTALRDRARRGAPLRYFTTDAVARYIEERRLYPAGSAEAAQAPARHPHL